MIRLKLLLIKMLKPKTFSTVRTVIISGKYDDRTVE